MRALLCRRPADWNELQIEEIDPPAMAPGCVRIAVEVASVSFAMSLQVAGKYQRQYPMPFVPGTEAGGVVTEVAPGVTQVVPGDRVLAILDWGGLAEQVVVRAATVYPVPAALPLDPGIHLPNGYGTGYGGLVWRGALRAGETVLVTGAAGAVGLAAVELAHVLGARVIAATSTEDKAQVARAHGADIAVTYAGLRDAVLQATGKAGVNLVFDPVGGAVFDEALRCVAPFGRYVVVGFASGQIPTVAINRLLVKNVSLVGHNMGYYYGWGPVDTRLESEPEMRAMVSRLFDWTIQGRLHPTVSNRFRLDQFREAMQVIRDRQARGKVIIGVRDA